MDDMSENAKSEQYQEKTGRESNPIGVAAVILLLCICFLIDARVPRQLRDELWLAVSQGEILWLVGKRRFAHALTSESTNKYFILEVK